MNEPVECHPDLDPAAEARAKSARRTEVAALNAEGEEFGYATVWSTCALCEAEEDEEDWALCSRCECCPDCGHSPGCTTQGSGIPGAPW